jgi:hypothetical protein
MRSGSSPHGEPGTGQVEIGEFGGAELVGPQGMDGDQREREPGHGSGRPVSSPATRPCGRPAGSAGEGRSATMKWCASSP